MLHFDFLEKDLGIFHFVYDFSRQIFLMLYSISWSNFTVGLSLLLGILGNMYCKCLLTRLWRHKFSIFYFFSQKSSYQAVFLHDRKVKTKISLSWKQKERSRWNKKHFSSFLKSFQIQKLIKSILIHEYQHKSTGVKKNQHESTRINTSLTRINASPTRVNTNQHQSTRVNMSPTQVNTNQHESNSSQHESARV